MNKYLEQTDMAEEKDGRLKIRVKTKDKVRVY